MVDGGKEYLRRWARDFDNFEDLSEEVEVEDPWDVKNLTRQLISLEDDYD